MWQKIKNIYHFFVALTATIFFQFPSKKITVIGVTGTDGKTTTVNMIYHVLKSAGLKTSMVSTVNAQIGEKSYDTGFHVTTPNPFQIQKFLAKAVKNGDKYFILEATSHGLDQNRLAFIDFQVSTITNITQDHFDYHKNWQNYASAKLKLFKNAKIAVLNLDDPKSYEFLDKNIHGKKITYGKGQSADVSPTNYHIKLEIAGDYNLSNALAASAVASSVGVPKAMIIKSLSSFTGIVGRMQEIPSKKDFKVIVDFAHTPNAIEQALKTLKSPNSQLIVVFGAAGERDRLKRKLMGQSADREADIIVLTSEDPRSENPAKIAKEIAQGIQNKKMDKDLFIELDRRKAIKHAFSIARSKDTVAILGKGHEKSMNIRGKEVPWSDIEIARQLLGAKNAR